MVPKEATSPSLTGFKREGGFTFPVDVCGVEMDAQINTGVAGSLLSDATYHQVGSSEPPLPADIDSMIEVHRRTTQIYSYVPLKLGERGGRFMSQTN